MIGWLPCLKWNGARWWLPLSASAAQDIASCMLLSNKPQRFVAAERKTLLARMLNDPPLMIYAALHQDSEATSPERLSDWLATNVVTQFACGDTTLGAPPLVARYQARWREVSSFFQTIPISRWVDEAALYLEITGPPVPQEWREQWPRMEDVPGDEMITSIESPSKMLGQLARLVQNHRSLQFAFDSHLQRQKLGALKQLAYGLSHEINNPLANISTRAQQLQRTELDSNRQSILQRIVDQTYRAHEMIADLMFYANPPTPIPQAANLRAIIERVIESMADQADRHSVRLKQELPETPTVSNVDDTMIGEAVRSLIRNAIEAIGCEGTIVVSLVETASTWRIHIADSGPGLSDAARRHAFDPYFSGREAGRGLGLGLCRAYRIARLHHGDISLAGGPAGCVATLSLPR